MEQAYRILPVYAGDVSGVCSALFELGGMVVIHDPSGCNSTYNTHDETRWYDYDSLIFISGLTDVDAIMGNDDKLVDDVVEAVVQTRPRFVALVNSPIPYQLGTDFDAIARLVEARTGVPAFHVATNGMHDYVRGAGLAFGAVAERLSEGRGAEVRTSPGLGVNVLGMTPLDFAAPGSHASLDAWVGKQGFETVSCWAMGSTLDELGRAGEASLDLVVSAAGLRAAHVLERRFGIPYVVGLPVSGFGDTLAGAMRSTLEDGRSRVAYLGQGGNQGPQPEGDPVALVGEPVCMGSLAAALRAGGAATRVVCPLEDSQGLVGPDDVLVHGEEAVERALAGSSRVVGDPFYQELCPGGAAFCRLPHLALSGRQWLHEAPDLVGWAPKRKKNAGEISSTGGEIAWA